MKTASHLQPQRAAVVPRGARLTGGEALPLETHIRALHRECGLIAIVGAPGAGKSTALAHLAFVLADLDVTLMDEPQEVALLGALEPPIVVAFSTLPEDIRFDVVLRLSPWGESERIDYLLAKHPAQTRSVMDRLSASADIDELAGSPQLWAIILDVMAASPLVVDLRAALRDMMLSQLASFGEDAGSMREMMVSAARSNLGPAGIPAFLKHSCMLRLAWVEALVEALCEPEAFTAYGWRSTSELQFDSDLIDLLAWRIRRDDAAIDWLSKRLTQPDALTDSDRQAQSLMMSVMLVLDRGFRPPYHVTYLEALHAGGVDWSGLKLTNPLLAQATFFRANLDRVEWPWAILNNADLRQASLAGASLANARLAGSTLNEVAAPEVNLDNADLTDVSAVTANFNGALMRWADFRRADLRGASFIGADLYHAYLIESLVAATDFSNASLCEAMCLGCDFRDAILHGVIADDATCDNSIFSEMQIDNFTARRARFVRADLTGSQLKNAKLNGANFRQAGLAEIDWPGADLRDADFTYAAFHMGSSRSGLVDSPIACEGSRTGFYTHDELETYKPPEAIRKANLCGANLIGAKVTGTDWYLVDLRGAQYTKKQALWFQKCGAILLDRDA